MSLLTSKQTADGHDGLRGRAARAARQAVPAAKQAAAPAARNAGAAARSGAQGAAAWAAPRVDSARSWAAPRIERSGIALRERIAPRVSDAMVRAAHKVDARPRKTRRWPKMLAGSAMLGAIVAMAAALRRRPDVVLYEPDGAAEESTLAQRRAESDGSQAEPVVNGQQRS